MKTWQHISRNTCSKFGQQSLEFHHTIIKMMEVVNSILVVADAVCRSNQQYLYYLYMALILKEHNIDTREVWILNKNKVTDAI